jgi:muramoyltetrapeptide carboxypeptidase
MLTHLRNAGKLENIGGVVFADMEGCNSDGTLWEVVADLFSDATYPVVYGLPSGHGATCLTVPLGLSSSLEGGGSRFQIGVVEEEANQAPEPTAPSSRGLI